MTKAELVVKVLEVDQTNVWPSENPHPLLEKYVQMIRDKYGEYRMKMDFGTAIRRARAETIDEILRLESVPLTYCTNCGHVNLKGEKDEQESVPLNDRGGDAGS